MRAAFAATLAELAAQDSRIMLLTGDLGYMALEPFADRFPDRFYNIGVAEQNMVGVATGLAEAGFVPFIYSIAPFATLRPYEFIRNGPIQHQLPVRIVGIGGGMEYSHNGLSHYALEDVAVMRAQPGITVIAPADHQQTRNALQTTWNLPGPIYYRLGKNDKTVVPGLEGRFELGKVQRIGTGTQLLLMAMGSIANETAASIQTLESCGIRSTLAIVSSVHPPPSADLAALLSQFPLALTVEAHYLNGGLGSLVSEVIAEQGLHCRLVRCAVSSLPSGLTGSQTWLHERHGISSDAIANSAMNALRSQIQ